MATIVKHLANNKTVVFDRGGFDDWCVYVVEPGGRRKAPYDREYFSELLGISRHYEHGRVYADFVRFYEPTAAVIDQEVLGLIDQLVATYRSEHQKRVEQWFAVIYAGMIAEENKQHAKLKKRIKRLGMYQVLMEGLAPEEAANFSKNRPWRELDAIMSPLGI